MTRVLIALAAVALLVAGFVVVRPEDEDESVPTTIVARTPTAPRTATPPPPPARPRRPAPARVRLSVRGGRAVGGVRRVTVARGRRVVLVVTADVADHVHLHGYDLTDDVGPGAPARIAFAARIPGRFEVELEERGLPLADIEVRP